MELEEFIETTLLSIKRGIRNTNLQIAKDNGKVLGEDATCQYIMASNRTGGSQKIKFDIGVTVSSEDVSKGEGKIKIAVFGINGSKGSASKEQNVSRIIFEISPNGEIS